MQYVGGAVANKAGATSGNSTISLSSLTGGIDTTARAGDLVIAAYNTGSAADRTLSITDGTTAYTLIGAELYANGTSYDSNLRAGLKYLTAQDASVTFGPTGNNADGGAMAVHVWRGVDPDTPLDVLAVTATGTGTGRPDAGAITPISPGAVIIVIGGGAAATGANFTAAGLSNFITTNGVDTNDGMVGVGSYSWTSGQYDPAQWTGGTTNATDSWTAITIALRPAAIALAGDAADVASATGALTTAIPLAGAALVVASSTADLTAGGAAAVLEGNAQAQAVSTATLSTQIPLSGVSASVSVANGSLTAQITLSANALAQAVASALLGTGISLSAAAQGAASASGDITTGILLAGNAQTVATASAEIQEVVSYSTGVTKLATGNFYGLAYGAGLFVSSGGLIPGYLWSSPDGINWTQRGTAVMGGSTSHIAFGNGIFVTAGNYSSPYYYYTSTDGINWTQRNIPGQISNITNVAFAGGRFIFASNDGEGYIEAYHSTDGVNWTQIVTDADACININTCAQGFFGVTGSGTHVHSTDGVNRTGIGATELGLSYSESARGIYADGYYYVAVRRNSDAKWVVLRSASWTGGWAIVFETGSTGTLLSSGLAEFLGVVALTVNSTTYSTSDGLTWISEYAHAPALTNTGGKYADTGGYRYIAEPGINRISKVIPVTAASVTQAAASGALSTAINLMGVALAQTSAAATITTQIKLTAAAVAQAAAAAGLSSGITLGGNALAQAGAGASLTVSIRLSTDAVAQAIASGGMTTQILLAGDAQGQAYAPATLTVQEPVAIDPRFVARRKAVTAARIAKRGLTAKIKARNFTTRLAA